MGFLDFLDLNWINLRNNHYHHRPNKKSIVFDNSSLPKALDQDSDSVLNFMPVKVISTSKSIWVSCES